MSWHFEPEHHNVSFKYWDFFIMKQEVNQSFKASKANSNFGMSPELLSDKSVSSSPYRRLVNVYRQSFVDRVKQERRLYRKEAESPSSLSEVRVFWGWVRGVLICLPII